MTVEVKNIPQLSVFIDSVKGAGVRRILLTDYATVEPKKKGNAFVLVGMVTLVATAFDRTNIFRWAEQDESERMVSITAGTGRGRNPGGRLIVKKDQVFQLLREEGFEVDEGEWTPTSAQAYLSTRRKFVG